jgi:membrane-bound metal-dependent hydrolase YbcI (DUF457 family)
VPYTPFHFGPGLLAKAASPRWISALTFAAANVAVDCEVAFNILRGHHPRHGIVHTILVAGPLGLAVGLLAAWTIRRCFPRTVAAHAQLREESSLIAGAVGGLLGGASHPLLDALGRRGTHPFWPWSSSNPLFGLMPYWAVVTACVVSGLLGIWLLARRNAKPATL